MSERTVSPHVFSGETTRPLRIAVSSSSLSSHVSPLNSPTSPLSSLCFAASSACPGHFSYSVRAVVRRRPASFSSPRPRRTGETPQSPLLAVPGGDSLDEASPEWETADALFERNADFPGLPDVTSLDEGPAFDDLAPSPHPASGVHTPEDPPVEPSDTARRRVRRPARTLSVQNGDASRQRPSFPSPVSPRSRELQGRLSSSARARDWTRREEETRRRGVGNSTSDSVGPARARERADTNSAIPLSGRRRARPLDGADAGASLLGVHTPEDAGHVSGSPASSNDLEGGDPFSFFGDAGRLEDSSLYPPGQVDAFSSPSRAGSPNPAGRGGYWRGREEEEYTPAAFPQHLPGRRRGFGARGAVPDRRRLGGGTSLGDRFDSAAESQEDANWLDSRALPRPPYLTSDVWRSPRSRQGRARDPRNAGGAPRPRHSQQARDGAKAGAGPSRLHEVSVHLDGDAVLGTEDLEDEGGFVTAAVEADEEDWPSRRSARASESWGARARGRFEGFPGLRRDRRRDGNLFFPDAPPRGLVPAAFASRDPLGLFEAPEGLGGKGDRRPASPRNPRFAFQAPERNSRGRGGGSFRRPLGLLERSWSQLGKRWVSSPFAAALEGERSLEAENGVLQGRDIDLDERRFSVFPVRIPPLVRSMDVGLLIYQRRDEGGEDDREGAKNSDKDGGEGKEGQRRKDLGGRASLGRQLRQDMDAQLDLALDDEVLGDLIDDSMRRRLLLLPQAATGARAEAMEPTPDDAKAERDAQRGAHKEDSEDELSADTEARETASGTHPGEEMAKLLEETQVPGSTETDRSGVKTDSHRFSFQAIYKQAVELYKNDPRLPQVHAQAEQIQRALASRIKRKISLDAALRRHGLPLNPFSWMARAFVYFNRFQLRNVLFTLWKDHVLHHWYRHPRRLAGAGRLPQAAFSPLFQEAAEERRMRREARGGSPPAAPFEDTETPARRGAEADQSQPRQGPFGAAENGGEVRGDEGEEIGETDGAETRTRETEGGEAEVKDGDWVGIEEDWRLYVQRVYGIDLAQHPTLELPLLVAKHVFLTQRYIAFVARYPEHRFRFISHKRWLAEQMRDEDEDSGDDEAGRSGGREGPASQPGDVHTPEKNLPEEGVGTEPPSPAEHRDLETEEQRQEKQEDGAPVAERGGASEDGLPGDDSQREASRRGEDDAQRQDEAETREHLPDVQEETGETGTSSGRFEGFASQSEEDRAAGDQPETHVASDPAADSATPPSGASTEGDQRGTADEVLSPPSSSLSSPSSMTSLSPLSPRGTAAAERETSASGEVGETENRKRKRGGSAKKGSSSGSGDEQAPSSVNVPSLSPVEAPSDVAKAAAEETNAAAHDVNNDKEETESGKNEEEAKVRIEENEQQRKSEETQAESVGVYGDMGWQAS
ncbi:conserved hypothetical protein [Neospora caninum Liverpool]|nr:conserved hypothetical protein [Neospora caninum Liverpool]CBZ50094.1 conserved hypothetical protein [Neospora caninum Liverpool]|eukprot:XP_003880129.1 conserved hypothetical protein [Neospora caninum Liverpool]